MRIKRLHILLIILVLCICAFPFRSRLRSSFVAIIQILRGKKTIAQRVKQYGDDVHNRLVPNFERIGINYPPKKVILVGLKQERLLEVWVSSDGVNFKYLKTYPILRASGALGPKLKAGDNQVPEGIYRVESLNPNSMYHLALRLDYPSDFDREKAKRDGRNSLDTDIMIHGKDCSIGCLAMGDVAAEDLFVLAAKTGIENCLVIISPVDFRTRDLPANMPAVPGWSAELYDRIRTEMATLKNGE